MSKQVSGSFAHNKDAWLGFPNPQPPGWDTNLKN
jgi:hypothetical protein